MRKGHILDTSLAPTLVVTNLDRVDPNATRIWREKGCSVVNVSISRDGFLNLTEILSVLGEMGILQLQVEGGPTLSAEFIRQGLVNELLLFTGSCVLGSTGRSWLPAQLTKTISDASFDWKCIDCFQVAGCDDIVSRYIHRRARSRSVVDAPCTKDLSSQFSQLKKRLMI